MVRVIHVYSIWINFGPFLTPLARFLFLFLAALLFSVCSDAVAVIESALFTQFRQILLLALHTYIEVRSRIFFYIIDFVSFSVT